MSAGIYRIINTITNEVYIGYTTNLRKRLSNYKTVQVQGQTLVYKSLVDYGIGVHQFDTLFDFGEISPKIHQLKQLEGIYIRYYKYWKGCPMLNSNEGGGGCGRWSEEKKKAKSLLGSCFKGKSMLQYDFSGNFVSEWKTITLASQTLNLDYNLLIKCCKRVSGNNSVGGFQWRYKEENETYRNISPYNIKLATTKTKHIIQYDLEGNFMRKWSSIIEASNSLKIPFNEIYKTLKSRIPKYNTQNKNIRFQFRYDEGNFLDKIPPLITTKILQYHLNGDFVAAWNSTAEIVNNCGFEYKNINSVLRNERKQAYKYQWRYSRNGDIPLQVENITMKPTKLELMTNKEIYQYDLYGNFIRNWKYQSLAAKTLKIAGSSIKKCCSGELRQSGGFQWRDKYFEKIPSYRVIQQCDLDWNLIKEWERLKFIKIEGIKTHSRIASCLSYNLNQAHGFRWKYKEPVEISE